MTGEGEPGPPPKEGPAGIVEEAIDWLRAIGLGIRDTAKEMMEAGRQGATRAYGEGWERFDEKTRKGRHRRG